jgi:nucleotide-binding universal stress UspA family protein
MKTATSFPPKTILVPLDFADGSLSGLEAARLLAGRWGSRVELVHVDQGPPPAFVQGADLWTTQALATLNKDLHRRLEAVAAPIPRSAAHLLRGSPAAVLSRLAADAAADLIVVAPRHRRRLPGALTGSVSEASVHAAHAPVLAVMGRPAADWPRRILAPVKWAPYADQALLAARAWAQSLGAELGLLHVYEGGQPDDMEERAVIEHVMRVLGEPSPRLRWHWAVGRPFEEIPQAAKDGRYDLVVLAQHLRDGWVESFLGTTAERVLRSGAVPVLAVPVSGPRRPAATAGGRASRRARRA